MVSLSQISNSSSSSSLRGRSLRPWPGIGGARSLLSCCRRLIVGFTAGGEAAGNRSGQQLGKIIHLPTQPLAVASLRPSFSAPFCAPLAALIFSIVGLEVLDSHLGRFIHPKK